MNALKQRWQSGCLGKAIIIGVALFACMVCGVVGTALQGPDGQQATPTVVATENTKANEGAATAPTKPPAPTRAPQSTNTPAPPTDTPIPTDTPGPTDTPAPTSTPPPPPTKVVGFLPGLMPSDVKVNLEERGHTCQPVEESMSLYVWTCQRTLDSLTLRVEFYARTLGTVDFIDASVLQSGETSDDFAAEYLGFIATMPYDNNDHDAARAWVAKTIPTLKGEGDVREATFGGVPFQLFGLPTARVLELGTMPEF